MVKTLFEEEIKDIDIPNSIIHNDILIQTPNIKLQTPIKQIQFNSLPDFSNGEFEVSILLEDLDMKFKLKNKDEYFKQAINKVRKK